MLDNLIVLAPEIESVTDFTDIRKRENRDNHRKVAGLFGLEFLGFGVTRVAFRLGDYVVKLGSPHHNGKEWGVWTRYSASQAATVLTPCYHKSDSGVTIIQKYAGSTVANAIRKGKLTNRKADELRDHIVHVLSSEGVRYFDLHNGNISADGLVLDYGHFG